MWPFAKKQVNLEALSKPLARDELLRRGRIAVLDDEEPEMLKDLRGYGLSVDLIHSTSDQAFARLEGSFYDILLLDYGGIGTTFGVDEGLDVLRHLKRTNPALRVLAFTGRSFDASKADFFRLTDGVVRKDAGIRETLEVLEEQLSELLTPLHYWHALCAARGLDPQSDDGQAIAARLLEANKGADGREKALRAIKALGTAGASKVADAIAERAVDLAIVALTAGN